MSASLPEKMQAHADRLNLPPEHEIRVTARELAEAAADPKVPARRLLGRWARARKVWCAATGEPLI